MTRRPYAIESGFLVVALAVGVAGFWDLYLGPEADPTGYHHLHVATSLGWLGLLFVQLRLVASARVAWHRRVGLSVLIAGPLVVASLALLTVHSAGKGLASGEGDRLIVQNVAVTVEMGVLPVLAFAALRRPRLHGAFLLSTALFFFGIALFLALLRFAPLFRIEGPETFYRFGTAALAAQGVTIAVAIGLFLNDRRHGRPYLLVAALFVGNSLVAAVLGRLGGADALTRLVGGWSPAVAFGVTFAVVLGALLAVGVRRPRRSAVPRPVPRPIPTSAPERAAASH